ncbi:MAG: hypothetical protein QOF89_2355 [Acidobacteriota bacterium]|jgi:hypothetical protein|nr:hypothetical protein [Acidobacteriota bacterium]
MSQRSSRLIFAVLSGLLAFGGCSAHRQLATQAVSFNLTVEKAQNEMLLLNVIRAKDRLPMYVTGISSLSGNFQTSLTSSLGTSLSRLRGHVPAGTDSITRGVAPSASATMSANPSFSLAVLDTQEFMKGFLYPIEKDLFAYYWDQGWRPELLLYLLVQRVEIEVKIGNATQTFVFENYPESEPKDPEKDLKNLEHFGCWLNEFLAQKPRIIEVVVSEDIGPPVSNSTVAEVTKLMQIATSGFFLKDLGSGNFQLQRQQTDRRFTLEAPHQDSLARILKCSGLHEPDGEQTNLMNQQNYYQFLAGAKTKMGVTQQDSATAPAITLVLRSPEALVYYLGELARVANRSDSPKVPYVCIQGYYQPLFVALPAGHCEDSLLEVDSGRGSFAVPVSAAEADKTLLCNEGDVGKIRFDVGVQCESGRSLHALNLLSQLISLHKSAKDLPATAVVRVLD